MVKKKISGSEAIRIWIVPDQSGEIGCYWQIAPPKSVEEMYDPQELKKGLWATNTKGLLEEIVKISKQKLEKLKRR